MPFDSPAMLQHWEAGRESGVSLAYSTREGGVSEPPYDTLNLGLHVGDEPSAVVENRARAAAAFGVSLEDLVFAQQVHGSGVMRVSAADRGRGVRGIDDALPSSDVLVTTDCTVVPVILVADCVPLALVDPEARVLALVHAGWRGTVANVVGAALRAMADCGGRPDRTLAYLGPGVSPARYQVGREVYAGLVAAVAPAALDAHVARPDVFDRWHVDLVAANRQQLHLAGIDDTRIHDSGASTAGSELFSDRETRPCGRFGLFGRLLP